MKMNLVSALRTQPRLVTAVLLGVSTWFLLPAWRPSTRLLAAWDCATGTYLVLAATMMARSTIETIRGRAAAQDEGQVVILGLISITSLVSLAGIMYELAAAKSSCGPESWRHVALAGVTVVLSWAFLHAVFAIHYAHEYYSPEGDGSAEGLDFPGDDEPDYGDFAYYAFVIGTACATADVDVTSRLMRRLTMLHSIVAFFFNATILSLAVNIGAGFF